MFRTFAPNPFRLGLCAAYRPCLALGRSKASLILAHPIKSGKCSGLLPRILSGLSSARLRLALRLCKAMLCFSLTRSSLGNVPDSLKTSADISPLSVLIPSSLGNVPDKCPRKIFFGLGSLNPIKSGKCSGPRGPVRSSMEDRLNPIKSGKCSGPYESEKQQASLHGLNPIKSGKCSGQRICIYHQRRGNVLIPSSLGNVPDKCPRESFVGRCTS